MSAPLTYVTDNIAFGRDLRDAWAIYRLDTASYPGLPVGQKIEHKELLEGFAYKIESDFRVDRVQRAWSAEDYLERAAATCSARFGHRVRWQDYLETQREEQLAGRTPTRPEVYLYVSLEEGSGDVSAILAKALASTRGGMWEAVKSTLGLSDARGLGRAELARLSSVEARCFERVYGFLDCERCSTDDVQWLIRRAYTRGLGEPRLDSHFAPQALAFVDGDGRERFTPLEADLLRLHDSRVSVEARGLTIDSELGTSHQACLCVGALPEQVLFPGPEAELMYSPLEALPFPVDATFTCRWIPNKQALALARRKKIDADHQYAEEASGEHGPSGEALERPVQARELEQDLSATDRPPLLLSGLALYVGASSPGELEQRVERLRDEYGQIALHRPLGEQHRLFVGSFPAQRFPVGDYLEYLTIDQFGAMVPTASNHAGSDEGPIIGYTLTEGRRPIQFDSSEASRQSRPPTVLMAGTLGSGKTMALELVEYQAYLQGALVCDVDPKGDHHLERLPGVAEDMEIIELTAEQRWRGLLDPLRIAQADLVFDLTVNFLTDLLRTPRDGWVLAIQEAVKATLHARSGRTSTCADVLERLAAGDEEARGAARALSIYADTGLAQLGFAHPDQEIPELGRAQVTSLRIRNLPRPVPGTPRAEHTEEERIGQAVLRLVAIYAMHLMSGDRSRPKVLGLDEAWFLMQDSVGHRLVEQLARWGRSENATVVLITHMVSDAEALENLIGTRFTFGFESEEHARLALKASRLDPDDPELVQALLSFRKGRCLYRDTEGRVVRMRVDPGAELLTALNTTPRAPDLEDEGDEEPRGHAPALAG